MSKPPFVEFGGEIVFSQPFEANGVHFYAFILPADEAKLTAYCDRTFNVPSGGQVKIKPAGPFVMLVFCNIDQLRAKELPFSSYGSFTEGECAFWLLTIDETRDRLFFAFPYIWVDNQYAMAMGRELYGFPKGIATFQMPTSPTAATTFGMTTLAVKEFGPEAIGQSAELIRVDKVSDHGEGVSWSGIKDGIALMHHMIQNTGTLMDKVRLGINELQDMIHLKVPFVFLKQFRDVADGSKACYQSVIEVPCGMTHFHGGGTLGGQYEVTIADCASHPIRADLGLPAGPIPSELSIWSKFDFEIGSGAEVWKA